MTWTVTIPITPATTAEPATAERLVHTHHDDTQGSANKAKAAPDGTRRHPYMTRVGGCETRKDSVIEPLLCQFAASGFCFGSPGRWPNGMSNVEHEPRTKATMHDQKHDDTHTHDTIDRRHHRDLHERPPQTDTHSTRRHQTSPAATGAERERERWREPQCEIRPKKVGQKEEAMPR